MKITASGALLQQLASAALGLRQLFSSQYAAIATFSRGTSPILCGEYDRKTHRGKRFAGTYGLGRRRSRGRAGNRHVLDWYTQPSWQTPEALPPYSMRVPLQQCTPELGKAAGNRQLGCATAASETSHQQPESA